MRRIFFAKSKNVLINIGSGTLKSMERTIPALAQTSRCTRVEYRHRIPHGSAVQAIRGQVQLRTPTQSPIVGATAASHFILEARSHERLLHFRSSAYRPLLGVHSASDTRNIPLDLVLETPTGKDDEPAPKCKCIPRSYAS